MFFSPNRISFSVLCLTLFYLLIGSTYLGKAQSGMQLKLVKVIADTAELRHLFDSLQMPLVLQNKAVYVLNAECFARNAGVATNTRADSAKVGNDRKVGSATVTRAQKTDADERKSSVATDERKSSSTNDSRSAQASTDNRQSSSQSSERAGGRGSNERSSSQNSNERKTETSSETRNAGSSSGYWTCGRDSMGQLIIYACNMPIDKTIKVYYKGVLYAQSSSFFKLKTK